MSRHTGFQQIGEDDSSVAPSRGVSDITGIELGSVMSGEVGFIMLYKYTLMLRASMQACMCICAYANVCVRVRACVCVYV